MQIKTLHPQKLLVVAILASALVFSCSESEKKTETEATREVETMAPAPVVVPDSMDTGDTKPVVPTTPK